VQRQRREPTASRAIALQSCLVALKEVVGDILQHMQVARGLALGSLPDLDRIVAGAHAGPPLLSGLAGFLQANIGNRSKAHVPQPPMNGHAQHPTAGILAALEQP